MTKDGKMYLLAVFSKNHPVAEMSMKTPKNYYVMIWRMLKTASRTYFIAHWHREYDKECDTVEEAIDYVKDLGFKIIHPKRRTGLN